VELYAYSMAYMKTKWISEVPKKEGWYWVKYRGKHGVVICPAKLFLYSNGEGVLHTARNDYVRVDRLQGLKFGPAIPFPA
jgi:hypothetical protein